MKFILIITIFLSVLYFVEAVHQPRQCKLLFYFLKNALDCGFYFHELWFTVFSFFDLVTVSNDACDAKNNLRNGTCYRASECEKKGTILHTVFENQQFVYLFTQYFYLKYINLDRQLPWLCLILILMKILMIISSFPVWTGSCPDCTSTASTSWSTASPMMN